MNLIGNTKKEVKKEENSADVALKERFRKLGMNGKASEWKKELATSKLLSIVNEKSTDQESKEVVVEEESKIIEKVEIERIIMDAYIFKHILKYFGDVYKWYKFMKFLSKKTMKYWEFNEEEYIWAIPIRYPLMMDVFISKYIKLNERCPKILNYFSIWKICLHNDSDAEEFIQFIKTRQNSYLHPFTI